VGRTTLVSRPPQSTTPPPSRVAPTTPPKSEWEDEVGQPNHQVMKFQVIAPSTPARTMSSPVIPSGSSTSPLATVEATAPPRWAPMKLPIAAMARAGQIGRAHVETEVAMAFAASWNPLVYAKRSAAAIAAVTAAEVPASASGRLDVHALGGFAAPPAGATGPPQLAG